MEQCQNRLDFPKTPGADPPGAGRLWPGLRIAGGIMYHRLKRAYDWRLSGKRYAVHKNDAPFPEICFAHQTPLYRNLPRQEMWLQKNKVVNLRLAVSLLDGVVVYPGQIFSYWRIVGKPAKKKGYVEGMVLEHGQIKAGVGGGLCQLTNLIYWMMLHTPLTVTERWRHSYDVFPDSGRTQPFGSGATCDFPALDLQAANTSDQPFQLSLRVTSDHLEGEWRCLRPTGLRYEIYEEFHQITLEHYGYVRHNRLRRRVFGDAKALVRDEPVTENHALMMYEPLLTEGIG